MTRFQFDAQHYPNEPGCYLMKGAGGQVLYVGKAKNLRRRLASYFRAQGRDYKVRRLAARVRDIEVILVNNEVESLVLESNLIKRYKPPFNVKLVDEDSSYFSIALTGSEAPRLAPYRKNRINKELNGEAVERYFGPYVSRRFRDILMQYVCEAFGIRTCISLPRRVCLRYHLGRCCGVCEAKTSPAEYARVVERVVEFLSHPQDGLVEQMKAQMRASAERLEFERAQRIRDQVQALEVTLERQIVERTEDHDQDVIYVGERNALVAQVRRGIVQGMTLFELHDPDSDVPTSDQFLLSHYATRSPGELIVNCVEEPQAVARTLTIANRSPVRITLPQTGPAYELLKLCERNYTYRVSRRASG